MDIQAELKQLAQSEGEPSLVGYVMKACQTRRAFCFSTAAADGWLVIEPVSSPTPHLLVVAAHCLGGDAIARYEKDVFAMALHLDLQAVRFRSQRKGYHRVMPKRGWRLLNDGETWEFNLG